MKKTIHNARSGFTLVETLVAVAVLMIAIAGPLTVSEKGLSAAIYARDQMTASYLAEDALEYVKSTIDAGLLQNGANPAWLQYGAGQSLSTCTSAQRCTVDTVLGQVNPPAGCATLILTAIGYVCSLPPGQSSSAPTVFSRDFYIVPVTVNNDPTAGADIVVDVTWPGDVSGGGGVTLKDTVFNTLQ